MVLGSSPRRPTKRKQHRRKSVLFLFGGKPAGGENSTAACRKKGAGGTLFSARVESPKAHHEKSIDFVGAFFNEINPFRICEIPDRREILLRNMKYACGV